MLLLKKGILVKVLLLHLVNSSWYRVHFSPGTFVIDKTNAA